MMFRFVIFAFLFVISVLSAPRGIFWVITDIHLQPDYVVGSSQLQACVKGVGNAGKYGGYYICDIPPISFEESLANMAKIEPNPDFILITGDMTPHVQANGITKEDVINYQKNVTNVFPKYFPNTRLLPILGNHDMHPESAYTEEKHHWIYETTADTWAHLYNNQTVEEMRIGGYFSELIMPGFRLVALNTNLFYESNPVHNVTYKDPLDQAAWFNHTMTLAKQNNERVLLHYHVPLGYCPSTFTQMYKERNEELYEMFQPFHSIIVAHLCGHNHADLIRIIGSDKVNGSSVAFLTPGLTEYKYGNPRFRLMQYQTTHPYNLIDFTQYITKISEANKNGFMKWEKEYNFREIYGVPDLSTQSILKVWENIKNNGTAFEYYTKFYRGVHYVGERCKPFEECHKDQVCTMRYVNKPDIDKCMNSTMWK